MFYRLPFVLIVFVFLASLLAGATAAAPDSGRGGGAERFIVVLKPGADVSTVTRAHGVAADQVYRHALKGFSAPLSATSRARLQADPAVAYVEADQVVTAFAQTTPTGIRRIFAPGNPALDIDGDDDYRVDVDVAVLDTGIDFAHPDLNVVSRADCASGNRFSSSCVANSGTDGDGHGTHVAGTVAALDNGIGVVGVAPGARLWAVRVLGNNGSGYMSWIIAGVDYVTAHASQIEVANMSLGCECTSTALQSAISRSVDAGVVYAVAAGNSDKDAATFTPANNPDVITVSALADSNGQPDPVANLFNTCRPDQEDTLADFSNYGSGVELAAPGVCILSTVPGGYATYSGTSMASPHAAGAAALLASRSNPNSKADVFSIRSQLVSSGNLNWQDDSGDGVKERLLDVSNAGAFAPALVAGSGPAPVPNSSPLASFSYTCSQLACDFNGAGSSDSDGNVAAYSWNFGDGGSSAMAAPSHSYSAAGSYQVILTVTDDKGATGSQTQTVTVSGPTASLTLSARGYKVKGLQNTDLSWSPAGSGSVDIWRKDGAGAYANLTTTANDGAYSDALGKKGGGSYLYKVCLAGTSTCSNEAAVAF